MKRPQTTRRRMRIATNMWPITMLAASSSSQPSMAIDATGVDPWQAECDIDKDALGGVDWYWHAELWAGMTDRDIGTIITQTDGNGTKNWHHYSPSYIFNYQDPKYGQRRQFYQQNSFLIRQKHVVEYGIVS